MSDVQDRDLSIADLLGTDDKKIDRLPIPEWGGYIYLRNMSATERSEIEDLFSKIVESKTGSGKFRSELLRRTWCDAQGNLVLEDKAVAEHMMKKSASAIERIFDKACEINAFRQKDVEVLKKK